MRTLTRGSKGGGTWPATSASPEVLAQRYSSLTPTAHGREERTTTPTDASVATLKGAPITSHQPHLDAIAYNLNNYPRAALDYRTTTQALNQAITTPNDIAVEERIAEQRQVQRGCGICCVNLKGAASPLADAAALNGQ